MSYAGARFAERMLTAGATARQHDLNPISLLAAALGGRNFTLPPVG